MTGCWHDQVGVYAALGIGNRFNKNNLGIAVKILGALAVIFVFWDIECALPSVL